MSYISSRLSVVSRSVPMLVSQRARALTEQGHEVIDLSIGEPNFATPSHVIEAAHLAALNGETHYTAPLGTPRLRQAVCGKFQRENGLEYKQDQIIISNGAKQIIFNALMAVLEEGDEAIIPAPYYMSYPEITKLLGGVPVVPHCPAETGFRLTPEILDGAISPRTKLLFLNSPGNPSGAVYSEPELHALGEVLLRHPRILVLSDEIYEHILFDGGTHVSFARACPDLRDRTLTINGVSKTYAMTGWRVGYAAGPEPLINAMATIQSQTVLSVSAVSQAAAAAALDGPQDEVQRFRKAYQRRRDIVVGGIEKIDGLTLSPPQGAFYAFIGFSDLLGSKTPKGELLQDDWSVVNYFLDEGGVASVPGNAYGFPNFLRISTATLDENLESAIAKLHAVVTALDRV